MDDYRKALEQLAADPHIDRYRELCDDSSPNVEIRDAWRAKIVRKASGIRDPRPPSVLAQAGTLARAGISAVDAAIHGESPIVGETEGNRRLAICQSNVCGQYDAAQIKCLACGCWLNWKTRLACEHCPLPEPLW